MVFVMSTEEEPKVNRDHRGQVTEVPLAELIDILQTQTFRCVVYLPGGDVLYFYNNSH